MTRLMPVKVCGLPVPLAGDEKPLPAQPPFRLTAYQVSVGSACGVPSEESAKA
jgi:hypothetical protein